MMKKRMKMRRRQIHVLLMRKSLKLIAIFKEIFDELRGDKAMVSFSFL